MDPNGLFALWAGPSGVAAGGLAEFNLSGGVAYEYTIDNNTGTSSWGVFGAAGDTQGLAASGGVEAGFYSGTVCGKTDGIILNNKAQAIITNPDTVVVPLGLKLFNVPDTVDISRFFRIPDNLSNFFKEFCVCLSLI